jgi:hypothetical protein
MFISQHIDMHGCFIFKEYEMAAHVYKINAYAVMGVVEHERSLRGTPGVAECFSDFSSALQLPECLYHRI